MNLWYGRVRGTCWNTGIHGFLQHGQFGRGIWGSLLKYGETLCTFAETTYFCWNLALDQYMYILVLYMHVIKY